MTSHGGVVLPYTDTRRSCPGQQVQSMGALRPFAIVAADSSAVRLDAAASFLREFPGHQPITIVAATRGAADDLARSVALFALSRSAHQDGRCDRDDGERPDDDP